ncbi:ATP-binding protein [Pseudonocardia adelaidensis]
MSAGAPRTFVGRAGPLTQLHEAWAAAQKGGPVTVLVRGEAGIGKSALVRRFVEESGVTQVFRGTCLQLAEDSASFLPFVAIMRDIVRGRPDGIASLVSAQALGHLAFLLPDLGETPGWDDHARVRLLESVLALVARLAADAPVVLVVEDVHWADPSTADLLAHLVANLPAGPVLLVLTARPPLPNQRTAALPADLAGAPDVVTVDLEPLDPIETQDLAAARGERDPGRVGAVHARSGGNPLHAHALLDSGGRGDAEHLLKQLAVPVEGLPAAARRLVHVLAVAGHPVRQPLLTTVSGLSGAALDAAAAHAAGIIDIGPPDAGGAEYRFRHPLVQEAVYRLHVLPGERTRLHARFAEAIEADPALSPPIACYAPSETARHWLAAGEPARAAAATWRSAQDGRDLLSHAEQRLAELRRLITLWPRIPDAERVVGVPWPQVLLAAVEAADDSGEPDLGMELAAQALAEARRRGAAEVAGAVRLRQAAMRRGLGLPGVRDDLRVGVEQAPVSGALRSRLLAAVAREHAIDGEWARAAETAALAERLAADAGDARAVAAAAVVRAGVATDPVRAAPLRARAAALAVEARAPDLAVLVTVDEAVLLRRVDRVADAVEAARTALEAANNAGVGRSVGARIGALLAAGLVDLGQWDDALDVLEPFQRLGHGRVDGWLLAAPRTHALAARGQLAGPAYEDVPAAGPAPGLPADVPEALAARDRLPLLHAVATAHLARGRVAEAAAALRPAFVPVVLAAAPEYAWPLLALAAELVALRRGRRPEPDDEPAVRRALAELPVLGTVQRAHRATALRALTERADAGTAREAELAAWEDSPLPLPLGWALLRAGEAALVRRDRAVAAERLARAGEIATELGAAPLAEAVGAAVRRGRLPVEAAPAATATPLAGLTAREQDVLRLLAEGLTNRQIAARLFLSPKTASAHVSRILLKLDAATRGEAAAIARRLGL